MSNSVIFFINNIKYLNFLVNAEFKQNPVYDMDRCKKSEHIKNNRLN